MDDHLEINNTLKSFNEIEKMWDERDIIMAFGMRG
jgi:hypothetical protein